MSETVFDYTMPLNNGTPQPLSAYAGKVLLIVNTASKCGFTPQYEGLQTLYSDYKARGFEILGFPCDQFGHQEPGNDTDIQQFCSLNFNVEFPLFKKSDVNGADASPLFRHLKNAAPGILGTKKIKWNFTKFLVNRDGEVVKRYAPTVKPEKLKSDIEGLL